MICQPRGRRWVMICLFEGGRSTSAPAPTSDVPLICGHEPVVDFDPNRPKKFTPCMEWHTGLALYLLVSDRSAGAA